MGNNLNCLAGLSLGMSGMTVGICCSKGPLSNRLLQLRNQPQFSFELCPSALFQNLFPMGRITYDPQDPLVLGVFILFMGLGSSKFMGMYLIKLH